MSFSIPANPDTYPSVITTWTSSFVSLFGSFKFISYPFNIPERIASASVEPPHVFCPREIAPIISVTMASLPFSFIVSICIGPALLDAQVTILIPEYSYFSDNTTNDFAIISNRVSFIEPDTST